jgi:formiminotetrahydrofolate cyclodeaminase
MDHMLMMVAYAVPRSTDSEEEKRHSSTAIAADNGSTGC